MPEHTVRKHVLFVDDEPVTQQVAARALRRDLPGVEVTCVDSGGEALQVLTRGPVDLLITSLLMPVIDGVELLRHVVNRRLATPVLVLGGAPDATRLASDALATLPEPIEIDRLVQRARALLSAGTGARGAGIGLRELVRLVVLARRTCALRVTHGDEQGVLYFTGGDLVDARAGDLHGDAAALAILMWKDVLVTFDLLLRARPVTIATDLDELLRGIDRLAASPPAPAVWEDPRAAATLARIVSEAMNIDGALGAGMAVWELDHILGTRGSLGPRPLDVAVSGNCRVMRALLTTLHRLGLRGAVHDVLITLDEQLHVLTPLPRHDELFLYLAIDRTRGNLALTRHRVQRLLDELAP